MFHLYNYLQKNSQEVPNFSQRRNMCFFTFKKKHEGTTSPRKFSHSPWKQAIPKRNLIFQPIICEGRAVKFQGRDNIVTKVTITKSDGLNLILRSFLFKQVIPFVIRPFLFVSYKVATSIFINLLWCVCVVFFGGWGGWMFVCLFWVNQNKGVKQPGGGGSKLAWSIGRVVGRLQMFVPWGMVAYSGSYRYAGYGPFEKRGWWRVCLDVPGS